MAAGTLVTALSIEDAAGAFVPLLLPGYRQVSSADGLAGTRVRKRARARTGRDGSIDRSRYRDDQPIVLQGSSRGETPDRAWAEYHATSGPLLDSVDVERRLRYTLGHNLTLEVGVRIEELSAPVEAGPNLIRWEAVLRAPDPRSYSLDWQTAEGSPLGAGESGGLRFPVVFPIRFAPPAGGIAAFNNVGTVSTPPFIELHGRLLNPVISIGQTRMALQGEIPAGGILLLDSSGRTVTLGTTNMRGLIDWSQSQWLMLPRGQGHIALQTEDFDAGAGMTVHWRNAYR